jgi:hypothetical protein
MVMYFCFILCILFFLLSVVGLYVALALLVVDVVSLVVGVRVFSAIVQIVAGVDLDLAVVVVEKSILFVFYCGSWCLYCNCYLVVLVEIELELLKFGY